MDATTAWSKRWRHSSHGLRMYILSLITDSQRLTDGVAFQTASKCTHRCVSATFRQICRCITFYFSVVFLYLVLSTLIPEKFIYRDCIIFYSTYTGPDFPTNEAQ